MKNKNSQLLELNAGTGAALGVIGGALVALIVQLITGDVSVWSWAISVGVACGGAIGAGKSNASAKKESQ